MLSIRSKITGSLSEEPTVLFSVRGTHCNPSGYLVNTQREAAGHLVQICQRTAPSTRCGMMVLQTRTTSFPYYQKGQAWLALACEFMNFSSPQNLPYQTSKHKPVALKMKPPPPPPPMSRHGPLFRSIAEQTLSSLLLQFLRHKKQSVPRVAQSRE